jgi:hypothetical protein
MRSIHALWSAAPACALALMVTLGTVSCEKLGVKKKTKTLNCDSTVVVNPKKLSHDSVYLCDGDTLTWSKGNGTDSFTIDFGNRTPFSDNATTFDDKHASHPSQTQYGDLDVYKYTITIVSGPNSTRLDPQVVTGGNP